MTVRKCITHGFFSNSAKLAPNGLYKTVRDGRVVSLHPSSVLYRSTSALPPWIVYHDVTLTSLEYIRDVTVINPKWLLEVAPHFYESEDVEMKGPDGSSRPSKKIKRDESSISSMMGGRLANLFG